MRVNKEGLLGHNSITGKLLWFRIDINPNLQMHPPILQRCKCNVTLYRHKNCHRLSFGRLLPPESDPPFSLSLAILKDSLPSGLGLSVSAVLLTSFLLPRSLSSSESEPLLEEESAATAC